MFTNEMPSVKGWYLAKCKTAGKAIAIIEIDIVTFETLEIPVVVQSTFFGWYNQILTPSVAKCYEWLKLDLPTNPGWNDSVSHTEHKYTIDEILKWFSK